MPRCQNCGTEYPENASACPNCGQPPEETRNASESDYIEDRPALLMKVYDGFEADMLEARLKSAGIPCYRKPFAHGDLDRVILGTAKVGGELYVPSGLLKSAKELLEIDESSGEAAGGASPAANGLSETTWEMKEEGSGSHRGKHRILENWSKKYFFRKLISVVIVILILAAYFSLDALLSFFRRLLGY